MLKKTTRRSQQLALLIPTLFLWTRILGQPDADNDCKTVVAVADLAKKAIRSAGYPSGYEPNKECTWELRAGRMFHQKKTIKVKFIVDIENSTDCSGESVTVHPFTSPNNTKLAVLCGKTEREYEFFIESLLVVFKSGSGPSQGRQGLKMVFQMIDETSCHERLDSRNYNTRAIHSPRYPDPYPSFQRCTYLIRTRTVNHNTELKVILSELSADCRDEYVMVYDGSSEQGPLLGKWCGSERPKFRSLVQELYVVFVSQDNSSGRKGFRADYRDAMCGGTALARHSFQNDIVFPGYSSPFNHYITCKWYIKPTTGYTSVLVAFRNLQVDCARSRITVHDGLWDTGITRTWIICGKEDYTYLISGPGMLVELNSQGNAAEPISFKIKHKGDNNTACHLKGKDGDKAYLLAYSYEQILLSPGYPDLYPDRIRCVWQVRSDHYLNIVMINVETLNLYSQPLCGDSVRIYHGAVSDLTKTPDMVLCHAESNIFYSDGRYATIDFITDDFGIGKGFRIVYKSTAKKNVRSEGTGVSHTVSSNTPMIAAVCSIIGVIIFIVIVVTCCFVIRKRRSDRIPQPPVVQTTLHPPPQTREQATPFLQTTTTDNTTNTSAPPPSYQDVNYLPVTEPSAPPMLPPSYEDAVTKGMIDKDSETRF